MLPSGYDIAQEKVIEAIEQGVETLNKVELAEKIVLATVEDIAQEKLIQDIETTQRETLQKVDTVEKNRLPSKEDIELEKEQCEAVEAEEESEFE